MSDDWYDEDWDDSEPGDEDIAEDDDDDEEVVTQDDVDESELLYDEVNGEHKAREARQVLNNREVSDEDLEEYLNDWYTY